jgi:ABC-2 type transport system ATP-binding protein
MSSPVARLENVSYRYRSTPALEQVNLELQPGRLTALLGPNGAGKTTLVKLLLGILQAAHGHVQVLGSEPGKLAVRQRIGTMLQISGVPDTLTVTELIALFSSFYPDPLPGSDVLAMSGTRDFSAQRFGKLSGGQRQRVMLALALAGRPDLLVLDEPGNGLDPASRRRLGETIREQARSGTSVVLCTHDLDEAARLADEVVILHQGRIIACDSPDALSRRLPNQRVRCRTSLDRDALLHLPGCRQVTRQDDGHSNRHEALVSDAPAFLRALLASDDGVAELEVRSAGLEAAFHHLTRGAST